MADLSAATGSMANAHVHQSRGYRQYQSPQQHRGYDYKRERQRSGSSADAPGHHDYISTPPAQTGSTISSASALLLNTESSIVGVKRGPEDDVTDMRSRDSASGDSVENSSPSKKKQKRNKPTLSCAECVERKTKCDRTRPACVACVKRQSLCRYSEIANLIASTGTGRGSGKTRKSATFVSTSQSQPGPLAAIAGGSGPNSGAFAAKTASSMVVDFHSGLPTPKSFGRSTSISSQHSSSLLLSHVPHTTNTPSLVFGTGSQHPFANYWTAQGGIAEVIAVLPVKEQADTFIAKFFEAVDPVYPMLHKEAFYQEYDHFWMLSKEEMVNSDASLLALHFTMYAMGAQFLKMEDEVARRQISEFYVSTAHQALRLYPFLSRTSLRSIEAMVLMAYFLMNDNKATDAWAFGGILVKQAYAMGLHRDPDIIVPRASAIEKNQRRKVWQAVFYQDTFFTVLVKLPPTTTFSDVSIDALTEDIIAIADGDDRPGSASIITNPMSISAIAPRQISPLIPPPPPTSATTKNDTAYIRSMWRLAELVQRTICQPRALAQPLTTSPRQKAALLVTFRNLYASFPPTLTDSDPARFAALVVNHPRTARQSLFLRSNYWHCVMLLEADNNEAAGVRADYKGALDAGRIAVGTFFEFWKGLTQDASVWWVFQHRAFEEALTMAGLLSQYHPSSPISTIQFANLEPLLIQAKEDVRIVLEILEQVGNSSPEMQKTRTDVLRSAFEAIQW